MSTYSIGGCVIHYQVMGEGPPIALTPGGRVAKEPLAPLAAKLARSHRVLLWDRRNTGASDVFIGGQGSEQEIWAGDLAALLEHLGMAPAYLAGGSAGCRVSLLTALRHPRVARGLVLWSASGGPYGSQVLGYNYHVPFIQAAQAGGMAAVAATAFFAERIQANPRNRDKLLSMDPGEFIAIMKRWNTFFYYRENTPLVGMTAADLASIKVPTLIFSGDDDIHPKQASDALGKHVPGAQLVPAPWTTQEWMDLYTGKVKGNMMEQLYPRLADSIAEFVKNAENA